MKNLNSRLVALLCIGLLFGLNSSFAQEKTEKKKEVQKKHKVVIEKNGETRTFEWESDENGEMPADVKKQIEELKKEGIDIHLDDSKENVFMIKREKSEGEPKSIKVDKKMIFINENGETKVIERNSEMSEEMKKKMDDLHLKMKTDEEGKSVEKEVEIFIQREKEGDNPEQIEKRIWIDGENGKEEIKEYELNDGRKVKVRVRKVYIIEEIIEKDKTENAAEEPAIKKEESLQKLNLYPNPSNGDFNLDFSMKEKGNTNVGVYDIQGNLIFEDNMKNFKGDYHKKIDLGGQKGGMYILRVTQNGKVYTRQIAIE